MPTLKHVEVLPALQGVRALQKERVSGLTGLKLRRLARQLAEHHQDADAERLAILRRYALLDGEGEDARPRTDERGQALFPSPDAERACREEIAAIYEGEVEISEVITLADLRRKERDEAGRVYETDDLPGEVCELLGALLVEGEQPAGPA